MNQEGYIITSSQNKKKLLYLVRTEADFERIVCLAIAGKGKFDQHFIFTGDFSPFFADGINNYFQKALFYRHDFTMSDFCDFDLIARILKKLCSGYHITTQNFLDNKKKMLIPYVFSILLRAYLGAATKRRVATKILKKLKPDALYTDVSITEKNYSPEIFRDLAITMNIPVFLLGHGAGNGLKYNFLPEDIINHHRKEYDRYYIMLNNKYEFKQNEKRIIIGDVSSSYPYVRYLNNISDFDLNYFSDKKYKVAFVVAGMPNENVTTNAWSRMEEIIIDLSTNSEVGIIVKLHPREEKFIDLRLIKSFDNVLIVANEVCRFKVTKWSDVIVCSDYCSAIFDGMILGKKVVALEGKHVPQLREKHSPLINSSIKHISEVSQFEYENIPNADPKDPITNEIAWGGNGSVDLAELFHANVIDIIGQIKEK